MLADNSWIFCTSNDSWIHTLISSVPTSVTYIMYEPHHEEHDGSMGSYHVEHKFHQIGNELSEPLKNSFHTMNERLIRYRRWILHTYHITKHYCDLKNID